jgi:hypothetical protein
MGQRRPEEVFLSSYIKLLRAHGEAYPGAGQDADELEAAYDAERERETDEHLAALDDPSGQTTSEPDATGSGVAGDDSLAPESPSN